MTLLRSSFSERVGDPEALTPISFDDAFPTTEKAFYVAPSEVAVPEAAELPEGRAWGYLKGTTYTTPEDYVAVLDDVLYCTTNHVVMPERGRILLESMNGAMTFAKALRPIESAAYEDADVVEGYVTSMASNFDGYYHQVVELLPRLLALNQPPYTSLDEIALFRPPVVYPIVDLILERVGRLKLRPLRVDRGRIIRAKHFLFTPFKTRQFAGCLPRRYVRQLRRAVAPDRSPVRRYRIFISREGSSKRTIRNQDELMQRLSPLGFEKVRLESLSPEEQVELFFDADVVVGAHGAGLTNLLFSSSARVLELFPRGHVEPHYLFLCKALGHTYRFWTNDDPDRWDLELFALRLRQRLRRHAHRSAIGSKPDLRANNLSFTVNVDEVMAILSQMGIR